MGDLSQPLSVDRHTCRAEDLAPAVEWLRRGGIIAFPTDTFYGLAVDPLSPSAVRRLFDLKGREVRAALPLVAASARQVEGFCGPLEPVPSRLASTFWPGPLSLIFDAPPTIAPDVHGGHRSVAIRVPDHRVALALCEAWGAPLTATSANHSGEPPARLADDLGYLGADSRVLVVNGGSAPGGHPSTIVDARVSPILLVRAGAIAWERVLRSANE